MSTEMHQFPDLLDVSSLMSQTSTLRHERRDALARQLATLYEVSAPYFGEREVSEFDVLFGELFDSTLPETRAYMSEQLAPIPNAPHGITLRLAGEDIEIARPVLLHSVVLTDEDLIVICEDKGTGHMIAIAQREKLTSNVSDVLVFRGDDKVRVLLAQNQRASISPRGFSRLAGQARNDRSMEQILVARPDLPGVAVHILVKFGSDISREALAPASAKPLIGLALPRGRELDEIDFNAAKARVEQLSAQGIYGEPLLMRFIAEEKLAESLVAFARIVGINIGEVKAWYQSDRPDTLLVAAKAYGLESRTVFGLLGLGWWRHALDPIALQSAIQRYHALTKVQAVKMLGLWRKTRHAAGHPGERPN